jgi:hypothetical protein
MTTLNVAFLENDPPDPSAVGISLPYVWRLAS